MTAGTPAVRAAKGATRTIPIVIVADSDPVKTGLVSKLARPGGNVTGLTTLSAELTGKRLQLLKEAVPGLSRVAVLWNPTDPDKAPDWSALDPAARTLRLGLLALEVRSPGDFASAFETAKREHAGALLVLADNLIARLADLPIEQPTKFEFVINLKAAKAIGLTIPKSVLVQADKLIE